MDSHVFPHPFGPPPKTGKLGNRAKWDRKGPEHEHKPNSREPGRNSPTEPRIHGTKNGKHSPEHEKKTVDTENTEVRSSMFKHEERKTATTTNTTTRTNTQVNTRNKRDPIPPRNEHLRPPEKNTKHRTPGRTANAIKKVGMVVFMLLTTRLETKRLETTRHMQKIENNNDYDNRMTKNSKSKTELTPTEMATNRTKKKSWNNDRTNTRTHINKAKYSFEYSVANKDCETNADVYDLQNTGNRRVLGHHVHHPIARKFHQKRKIGEMLSKFLQPHRSTFTQHTPRKISTPNIARIADPK